MTREWSLWFQHFIYQYPIFSISFATVLIFQLDSSELGKLIPFVCVGEQSGDKMPVVGEEDGEKAVVQIGTSIIEQLVPEITMHALSYLDYPSLCRLSMTNSLMHKVANDENAWKALYHKVGSLEDQSWDFGMIFLY